MKNKISIRCHVVILIVILLKMIVSLGTGSRDNNILTRELFGQDCYETTRLSLIPKDFQLTLINETMSSDSIPLVDVKITTLETDFNDFLDLVPTDVINELKIRYYISDPAVRQAYDFLKKYDYNFILLTLCDTNDIKNAMIFLTKLGLNIQEMANAIIKKFGPPELKSLQIEGNSKKKLFSSFIKIAIALTNRNFYHLNFKFQRIN